MTLVLNDPKATDPVQDSAGEPPALRPYQQDAVAAVIDADRRDVPSVLGVAATGLGKTIIVGALARALGRRTLVLAHREQLIDQAVEKVGWCWPGARVGAVQGARDAVDADVVVASVQTLIQPGRLQRIGDFGLVVVDECHHAPARSYRRILDGLGAGAGDGSALLVGVTATPDRGDAASLESIFTEQVFSYDLVWGIRQGYLSDLVGMRVRLELDLSDVGVRGGDYDDESLGRAMERAGAPFHIVEAWCEHAASRRTVVFVPTIRVAEETAEAFRARGIAAGTVSDGDKGSRKATLDAFSAGELQVLVNCAVLTEGYDEPRVDCIVLARPTRSKALYMQCVGRGTRRHPEKNDCLVLDMTGAADDDRDLIDLPSLLGVKDRELGRRIQAGERTALEALALEEAAVAAGRLSYEDLDIFAALRSQRLCWVQAGDGVYACSAGGSSVLIEPISGGAWSVAVYDKSGDVAVLLGSGDLELAQGVGEDYVRSHANATLVASDAKWRSRPPSSGQLLAASRWRVEVRPEWSAGDVSAAIDAAAAMALRKKAARRRETA